MDTALALADLIKKIDRSYRIDLKYAIIFGGKLAKGGRRWGEGCFACAYGCGMYSRRLKF